MPDTWKLAKKYAVARPTTYALFWCTGEERDGFMIALSSKDAARTHAVLTGESEARAQFVGALSSSLLRDGRWHDPGGKKSTWRQAAGRPSEKLLIACGGKISEDEAGDRVVTIGDRAYVDRPVGAENVLAAFAVNSPAEPPLTEDT